MTESPTRPSRLSRERLSDRAAAELKRLVVGGVYPPGSKLPSEKELAEQLGVTRLTVREALAQLEAAGFTQTRHGSGTYVADLLAHTTLHMLEDMIAAGHRLGPGEVSSLLALREVLLLGFADQMIAGATPERIAALHQILAEERAAAGDPARLAALDYRLNQALAEASGNFFYLLLLRSVREAHLRLGEVVFRGGDAELIIATHESMVEALASGVAARFKRRLEVYLSGGRAIVEAWLAPKRAGRRGGET